MKLLARTLLAALLAASASAHSHYFSSAKDELAARHFHLASRPDRAAAAAARRAQTEALQARAMESPPPRRRAAGGAYASTGFDYTTQKVRGVNLGNWLVLEPWMDSNASSVLNAQAEGAPGTIVDEYQMGQYIDREWLTSFFTEHFDSWITEDDFREIAAAGLNHVRIPIGHWAWADCIEDNAPYLALNRLDKLKQGVLWAKQYGLRVWIDLHGVPGSQNSYPGSGRSTAGANWARQDEYYRLTQRAFNYLVAEFTQPVYNGTVTAIQPVNEPIGAYQRDIQGMLNKYYPWAWDALAYPNGTDGPASSVMLSTHDGWQGLSYYESFYNTTQRGRVIMDAHPYFVYGSDAGTSKDTERLGEVCGYGVNMRTSATFYPTVAGEWSIGAPRGDNIAVLRDLPDSDAVRFGSGTGSSNAARPPFTRKYMQFLAVNFRAQQQIFENDGAGGWLFWNWKHLAFADQSYQAGVRYGWLPASTAELDAQPYGQLCEGVQFKFSGSNGQTVTAAGAGSGAGAGVRPAVGVVVVLAAAVLAVLASAL